MPDNPYANYYANEQSAGEAVGPMEPMPESVQGWHFPYRGGETHGVDPTLFDIPTYEEDWEGGKVEYKEPEEPPTPVLVKIVEESANERDEWRAFQTVADGLARIVVGRHDKRTNLKIYNLDADTRVWVGGDSGISRLSGFPVNAGSEFSLSGTEEVWAVSDDGSQCILAVMLEYTVTT